MLQQQQVCNSSKFATAASLQRQEERPLLESLCGVGKRGPSILRQVTHMQPFIIAQVVFCDLTHTHTSYLHCSVYTSLTQEYQWFTVHYKVEKLEGFKELTLEYAMTSS